MTRDREAAIADPEAPVSPRIATLQRAVLAGDAVAVEDFWQEVARHGAPLVEPLVDDPTHTLVTFLWRATTPTLNVSLIQDWGGENRLADQLPFRRLAGTDLWYACRHLPINTRLLYQPPSMTHAGRALRPAAMPRPAAGIPIRSTRAAIW